ncbi:hypothetical protein ACFONI_18200 [Aeromonas media]|uniref:hypothetical protein n=1 Tax=Aeromonas media TaxID=651 RepID=UPI00361F7DDC
MTKCRPKPSPLSLPPGLSCRNGCGRGWPRPKEPGPEAEIAQRQTTEDEKRTLAFSSSWQRPAETAPQRQTERGCRGKASRMGTPLESSKKAAA